MAEQVHIELVEFLENMNNPDDLLSYGTQYFVLMSYRKEEEQTQEGEEDCWLEPQTELGQFARELSLALRSLQFEVRWITNVTSSKSALAKSRLVAFAKA